MYRRRAVFDGPRSSLHAAEKRDRQPDPQSRGLGNPLERRTCPSQRSRTLYWPDTSTSPHLLVRSNGVVEPCKSGAGLAKVHLSPGLAAPRITGSKPPMTGCCHVKSKHRVSVPVVAYLRKIRAPCTAWIIHSRYHKLSHPRLRIFASSLTSTSVMAVTVKHLPVW